MSGMGSFIKHDLLTDIRGRLKFVSKPLQEHLDKIELPAEPQYTVDVSQQDQKSLDLYGITHQSFSIILNRAISMAHDNEMVAAKMKELLAITKLYDDDTIAKALKKHRADIAFQEDQMRKRDRKYQAKLRSVEQRRGSIRRSWEEVEEQVRSRWSRILKGIAVALQRTEYFEGLHPHDQFVVRYLSQNSDWVKLVNGRVTEFDVDMLRFVDINKIAHIVDYCLNTIASEQVRQFNSNDLAA